MLKIYDVLPVQYAGETHATAAYFKVPVYDIVPVRNAETHHSATILCIHIVISTA